MSQLRLKQICSVLLLFILPMLWACSSYPRYQPISNPPFTQGYQTIQIDKQTFLIFYENYSSGLGLLLDPLNEKWLQGAQEYALYRAGEFAKSKGASHFVVLHKDDWNLLSVWNIKGHTEPGAGLVIRVLDSYPSTIQLNTNRVHEVSKLLQELTERNRGLAEYEKKTSPDESMKNPGTKFSRWRSSVGGYNSAPVPGRRVTSLFGSIHIFVPGNDISRGPAGEYQIAAWEDTYRPISPIQFLWQCATLARQEGFKTFKLVNWVVEEYRSVGGREGGKVWFKTRANLIPQSEKDSDSLEPVFIVDELFVDYETAGEHR